VAFAHALYLKPTIMNADSSAIAVCDPTAPLTCWPLVVAVVGLPPGKLTIGVETDADETGLVLIPTSAKYEPKFQTMVVPFTCPSAAEYEEAWLDVVPSGDVMVQLTSKP